MAEMYPSDNELLNLVNDPETGVEYIATGTAPYYLEFRKLVQRLILAGRRANDLRVYPEGGLAIGVKAGKFWVGTQLISYAGSTGTLLADNKASIYVYINSAGALVSNEYNGFPDMATAAHLRLAVITTAGGTITNISDARDQHILKLPDGAGGIRKAVEAHTANDTLISGESGSVHTNRGAVGVITITLPASAPAGTIFTLAVQESQDLRVDPGTGAIRDECGVAADKYKHSSTIGASLTLVCDAGGDWITIGKSGVWSQEA